MNQSTQTDQEYYHIKDHPFGFPGALHIKTWRLYAKRRGVHSEGQEEEYQ